MGVPRFQQEKILLAGDIVKQLKLIRREIRELKEGLLMAKKKKK
jgi:hypothetical protein